MMKKYLCIFIAAAFLAACSAPGETPESVAEKFLNHLSNQEFEEAKAISTEETDDFVDLLASFSEMMGEEAGDPVAIDYVNCEESGDTADCNYCCDEEGNESTLKLKKVDDKWLVHMSKEDMFGDMGDWDDEDWEDDWDEEAWGDDEWEDDESDY